MKENAKENELVKKLTNNKLYILQDILHQEYLYQEA